MAIDFTKEAGGDQASVLARLKQRLKERGWGVLSDIDARAVLKEKLGVEIEPYDILDVCNPALAEKALKASKKAGLVLPCKMVVFSDDGKTKLGLYLPTKQLPEELRAVAGMAELAETAEASLLEISRSV